MKTWYVKCSDAEREKETETETETETRALLLRAQRLRLPLFRIFELLPLLTPTRLLSLSLSLSHLFLSLSLGRGPLPHTVHVGDVASLAVHGADVLRWVEHHAFSSVGLPQRYVNLLW